MYQITHENYCNGSPECYGVLWQTADQPTGSEHRTTSCAHRFRPICGSLGSSLQHHDHSLKTQTAKFRCVTTVAVTCSHGGLVHSPGFQRRVALTCASC